MLPNDRMAAVRLTSVTLTVTEWFLRGPNDVKRGKNQVLTGSTACMEKPRSAVGFIGQKRICAISARLDTLFALVTALLRRCYIVSS